MQSKTLSAERAGTAELSEGEYRINEVFYSIQGEGRLAGTAMAFVRFAHCNLRCSVINAGFDCDTEFETGREMGASLLLQEIADVLPPGGPPGWVLLTGGEPGLQVDHYLIEELKIAGYAIAIETNGTIKLPEGIDWVCVSPKSADHTIKQRTCDEFKMVRAHGQELPEAPPVDAECWVVSPPFSADGALLKRDAEWCVELVKEKPEWRLSLQTHKILAIR